MFQQKGKCANWQKTLKLTFLINKFIRATKEYVDLLKYPTILYKNYCARKLRPGQDKKRAERGTKSPIVAKKSLKVGLK